MHDYVYICNARPRDARGGRAPRPTPSALTPRNRSQLGVSQLPCALPPAYSTLSSRGLGLYRRPTLDTGFPSTSTTSAVKSNRPW